MKTFEIHPLYSKILWLFQWFSAAFGIFAVALAASARPFGTEELLVLVFMICYFTGYVWFVHLGRRKVIESAVQIDDEGIWYRHKGKQEGLVPWSSLRLVKERNVARRFDLCDDQGQVLIQVPQMMQGIEELATRIAEELEYQLQEDQVAFPLTYRLSSGHRIMLGFILTIWAVVGGAFVWVGETWVLLVIFLAGWSYFGPSGIRRLSVDRDEIRVKRFLRLGTESMTRSEMSAPRIRIAKLSLFPGILRVEMIHQSGQRLILENLNGSAIQLAATLNLAKQVPDAS